LTLILFFSDYGDSKIKKEEKVLEDKKKHVKSLIDRIPTEKDALFAYEIDWSMVDNVSYLSYVHAYFTCNKIYLARTMLKC